MRDPQRIPIVIAALTAFWMKYPDMRLGQIVVAATGNNDPFHCEDKEVLDGLARLAKADAELDALTVRLRDHYAEPLCTGAAIDTLRRDLADERRIGAENAAESMDTIRVLNEHIDTLRAEKARVEGALAGAHDERAEILDRTALGRTLAAAEAENDTLRRDLAANDADSLAEIHTLKEQLVEMRRERDEAIEERDASLIDDARDKTIEENGRLESELAAATALAADQTARIAKLEAALKFYAETTNWTRDYYPEVGASLPGSSHTDFDHGDTARDALARTPETK